LGIAGGKSSKKALKWAVIAKEAVFATLWGLKADFQNRLAATRKSGPEVRD
jgi:hypothetical protein